MDPHTVKLLLLAAQASPETNARPILSAQRSTKSRQWLIEVKHHWTHPEVRVWGDRCTSGDWDVWAGLRQRAGLLVWPMRGFNSMATETDLESGKVCSLSIITVHDKCPQIGSIFSQTAVSLSLGLTRSTKSLRWHFSTQHRFRGKALWHLSSIYEQLAWIFLDRWGSSDAVSVCSLAGGLEERVYASPVHDLTWIFPQAQTDHQGESGEQYLHAIFLWTAVAGKFHYHRKK